MHFDAIISLNDSSSSEILSKAKFKYSGCKSDGDSITIKTNEILISGERTSNHLSNAYEITHSTLYDHFINSLLVVFFTEKKLVKIKSIKVNNLEFSNTQITQFFSSEIKFEYEIKKEILLSVLNYKNKRLRNTLLYFIQSLSAPDSKRKFERLWMSFNCLYSFDKTVVKESEKLKYIKNRCVSSNSKYFSQSLNIADIKANEKYLMDLRWEKFLKNKLDFELSLNRKDLKNKKEESEIYEKFYDEIYKTYSDYRILDCLVTRLTSKSFYIKKTDKTSDTKTVFVNTDLINKLDKKRISNEKKLNKNKHNCLQLLGIDYAYFLRCTFFHGAVNDSYYELLKIDAFDNELNIINPILSSLIIDLINSKLITN